MTTQTDNKKQVMVDGKELAAVKRGLTAELKKVETLRETYRLFGKVNYDGILSIGGKVNGEGKLVGYDTKLLNAWRIDNFPTLVKDGKLKDGALFSHAINFYRQYDEVIRFLEETKQTELYRPDTVMKKYSAHQKKQAEKAEQANETEEEAAIREANETHEKVENLLKSISGPLASLRKLMKEGKVDTGRQRELAMILCETFDYIDPAVQHTAQSDYQQQKAEKHEEVRDAEMKKVA